MPRPLRLGIDLTNAWTTPTGTIVYAIELTRALVATYPLDQVTVLCSKNLPPQLEDIRDRLRIVASPTRNEVENRFVWIQKLCANLSVDLFHFPVHPPPLGFRFPYSFMIHDLTVWLHPKTANFKYRWYLKALLWSALRDARVTVTYTASVANELRTVLRSRLRSPIAVTPMAARSLDFGQASSQVTDLISSGTKFILSAATLEPRKNLVTLLKALPRSAMIAGEPVTLVLAGGLGWRYGELIEQLRLSGADNRIIHLGYVDPAALRSLYKAACFLVSPSIYEGFDLPTIEAMSQGCPVLASDIPVHREVLGDAAEYFETTSTEDLALKIGSLWRDEGRRESLVDLGIARVGLYSWSKTAQMTRDALASATLHG